MYSVLGELRVAPKQTEFGRVGAGPIVEGLGAGTIQEEKQLETYLGRLK